MSHGARGYRGSLLDYASDPALDTDAVRFVEDGVLVVRDGHIEARGDYAAIAEAMPDMVVEDLRGKLIMPGLVDAHVHFPQTTMIASYGEQLLPWLENYAFPTEARFADPAHAEAIAGVFTAELLRHGTTTALVLCTVHSHSVDALARCAQSLGMRMVLGKVSMDRHAPEALRDSADTTYREGEALIQRWHGNGRLSYALTPRFAASCSERQLLALAQLHRDHPTTYMHSHLAENREELAWVQRLFPERRSYTDVYDHYGLLTDRSVFAHGIHLDDRDLARLAETGTTIAFCPTSNLFLGSGLFPYARAKAAGVRIASATDVGAGTSFNMFQTLAEAYKVLQLQGTSLSVHEALHLATLGSAESLGLGAQIGNFDVGKEADFIVVDAESTPLMRLRMDYAASLDERLFALMMLADDRAIEATYVAGKRVHRRSDHDVA